MFASPVLGKAVVPGDHTELRYYVFNELHQRVQYLTLRTNKTQSLQAHITISASHAVASLPQRDRL